MPLADWTLQLDLLVERILLVIGHQLDQGFELHQADRVEASLLPYPAMFDLPACPVARMDLY